MSDVKSGFVDRFLSFFFKKKQEIHHESLKIPDNFFEPRKQLDPDPKSILFPVTGAGIISITDKPKCRCGESVGFGFGVSWGGHGYIGGVIGRTQAVRMAKMIIDACSDITETEEEEIARLNNEMEERLKTMNS